MGFTFKQNTAFQPISKHLKEEEEELHISDLLQFQLSPASACEFPFQLAREKQAQLRELRQIQSESGKKKAASVFDLCRQEYKETYAGTCYL